MNNDKINNAFLEWEMNQLEEFTEYIAVMGVLVETGVIEYKESFSEGIIFHLNVNNLKKQIQIPESFIEEYELLIYFRDYPEFTKQISRFIL